MKFKVGDRIIQKKSPLPIESRIVFTIVYEDQRYYRISIGTGFGGWVYNKKIVDQDFDFADRKNKFYLDI